VLGGRRGAACASASGPGTAGVQSRARACACVCVRSRVRAAARRLRTAKALVASTTALCGFAAALSPAAPVSELAASPDVEAAELGMADSGTASPDPRRTPTTRLFVPLAMRL